MKYLAPTVLGLSLFAAAGGVQAFEKVKSLDIDFGIYYLDWFNQNSAAEANTALTDSETFAALYGRTNGFVLNDAGLCDDKNRLGCSRLTLDLDLYARKGINDDASSAYTGRINLYWPIWTDWLGDDGYARSKEQGVHGAYDPNFLPPVTVGISAAYSHADLQLSGLDDPTEIHLSPFIRLYKVFANPFYKDPGSVADWTFDAGVDWVDSDIAAGDHFDQFVKMNFRFNVHKRLEFGARLRYLNQDFDSGIEDINQFNIEGRVRYEFLPLGEDVGLYVALTLGHQVVDGTGPSQSQSYWMPGIYFQYPREVVSDTTKLTDGGYPWGTGRGSVGGNWYGYP